MLSNAYQVYVSGRETPVYNAKIGAADNVRRFKAVDDILHSADYYDNAAFTYFDMQGSATITVTIGNNVNAVKILPAGSAGKPAIHGHSLSFKVTSPKNLTVEINGEWVKSLHIFINSIETDLPDINDPDVVYFGPGVHEVSSMVIGDNKTIYIAGGAVVKAVIAPNQKVIGIEPSGLKNYNPVFILKGNNIKLRGRGIIDASGYPVHGGNFLYLHGSNISLDGIILLNSCGWTVPVRQCDKVVINDIKLLGYRANSDGIDICNSSNVTVENCFIRTNDDLVAIKSWEHQGPVNNIVIKNCVLWNQLAHALTIGSELRENISNVLFIDNDIIHDTGREWSMRIFQADSSTVQQVRFQNIRADDSHRLISLWIDKDISSFTKTLGYIKNVTFDNINAAGSPLTIELHGGNFSHKITNVVFKNVIINGKLLTQKGIESNAFNQQITITP